MEFDAEAAASAQKFAEKLNRDGVMAHSPGADRPGCGENLAGSGNAGLM